MPPSPEPPEGLGEASGHQHRQRTDLCCRAFRVEERGQVSEGHTALARSCTLAEGLQQSQLDCVLKTSSTIRATPPGRVNGGCGTSDFLDWLSVSCRSLEKPLLTSTVASLRNKKIHHSINNFNDQACFSRSGLCASGYHMGTDRDQADRRGSGGAADLRSLTPSVIGGVLRVDSLECLLFPARRVRRLPIVQAPGALPALARPRLSVAGYRCHRNASRPAGALHGSRY